MTNKPYTYDQLEKDVQCIVDNLKQMRTNKNHDYAGAIDAFTNFRTFGSFGVLVRISDKFSRLKTFYEQKELKVHDETISDTMNDLINYAIFLKILWEQENTYNNQISYGDVTYVWKNEFTNLSDPFKKIAKKIVKLDKKFMKGPKKKMSKKATKLFAASYHHLPRKKKKK